MDSTAVSYDLYENLSTLFQQSKKAHLWWDKFDNKHFILWLDFYIM